MNFTESRSNWAASVGVGLLFIGLFLKDPSHEYLNIGDSRNQAGSLIAFIGVLFILAALNYVQLIKNLTNPIVGFGLIFLFFFPLYFLMVRGGLFYVEPLSIGFLLALLTSVTPASVVNRQLLRISIILSVAVCVEAVMQKTFIATIDQVSGVMISEQWLQESPGGQFFMRAKGFSDSPHKTAWGLILIAVLARPNILVLIFFCLAIMLTGARLPFFGFGLYLVICAVCSWYGLSKEKKIKTFVFLCFSVVVAVSLFKDRFLWTLDALVAGTSSNQLRAESWVTAWDFYFNDYGVFDKIFGKYGLNSDPLIFHISPENDWLSILLTFGLAGVFFIAFAILVGIGRSIINRDVPLTVMLLLSIIFMGHSFIQSVPVAFLFFLLLFRLTMR